MTHSALVGTLHPLVRAEATAEAPGAGLEPADLEQSVWVRLLERRPRRGRAADPAGWVRAAVRAEVRAARTRARHEQAYRADVLPGGPGGSPEGIVEDADERRALRAAVDRLPGKCPLILAAMLASHDPTYREIAGELGISQGSLGPMRSRCLGCLRRMLAAEVAASGSGGMER
ncbi:sigma-70 family RNA polymerase sigma factor [Streptomyces nitrosporeus]|uniref:Sigma-70 family RNA polymerase sigma factor n=1 Tax=Streptomyces nitrosporeus TaxID=28894 RepID=A0A5J6FGV8_9ACTN|nr:sigma-70 family RNA polymerase sigma factor [Streptomyces nitrosporeus]QEU75413.1 sigma-70 family RNA polymerase sigma factor [Streptomyces nitrosporeus]GGZ02254.1 RNA polymerase sigma factor [Streptomyces nitrosporeus]